VERLNLFAPHVRSNPYPHYAELRRSAPVTQLDPGGIWGVSRYSDIISVLKNPTVFSSQGLKPMTLQPWIEYNPMSESMILMDPPRHTNIRALVTHAFSMRVIPRIEPLARKVSADFVARVRQGGEIELCEALSMTLPAAVIAELLGFDSSLTHNFHIWAQDLVSINPGTPPEARPRILQTVADMSRYLKEVLADRRRTRRDDLVSDLIDVEVEGQRLNDEELVSFLFLLLTAGFETTTHLLTQSMRVLADHPELIARLRAEPASIPAFVEEVLRFESPVHGTLRLTIADAEVGGVHLPPGSVILALLGSANRDETQFEQPDRFDMDRKQRPGVPFGHGVHFCLGAALSRAEARIALEELLPQIKGVRVTHEPEWNLSMTVRGPTSCRMEFQLA
jgi:cytochrome P450